MIRWLNADDKQLFDSAEALWRECFPEDDEIFTESYFTLRTKPQSILAYTDDASGEMLACLHAHERSVKVGTRFFMAYLIAGVGTAKKYRHRGLAKELLNCAKDFAKARGAAFVFLVPFDFAFYEQFGYRAWMRVRSVTLFDDGKAPVEEALPFDANKLCAHWDDSVLTEAMANALSDEYRRCGEFCMTRTGYALGYTHVSDGEKLLNVDYCCGEGAVKALMRQCGAKRAVYVSAGGSEPYNMILPLTGDFETYRNVKLFEKY